MPRYREPKCAAPFEDTGRPCGHAMRLLGERHPSFGPNFRPGCHVFECPRCGAVRALDDQMLDRYAERLS